jgi:hypothetical protein
MRRSVLLPVLAAVIAAGCGSGTNERETRSVPKRDLRLVTPPKAVEIASRIESGMLRAEPHTSQHPHAGTRLLKTQHPTPAPQPKLADEWVPKLVLASPRPPVQPANPAATPTDDRELPPGKTVTVIPASSGPTTETGGTDNAAGSSGRARVGHHGGRCGGRGLGPGVSAAPRPDFR